MAGDESYGGRVTGILDDAVEARLTAGVAAALRRRSANEALLAGCLRCLAPYSPRILDLLERVLRVLIKRGSCSRALYAASVRGLAEIDGRRVAEPLAGVLGHDEAGGLASLSAACWTRETGLAQPLARVAISRHPHLSFAAEVARIARGESGGEHIASVAPKIKESHRISLCAEIFVPLLRGPALPLAIAPALSVLRCSERHLGRWLVLAEIAVRAGDGAPLSEARQRAVDGPRSAQAAWAMVAWALTGGSDPPPSVRPTIELMARLSDRPSAERDPTFLFRLAEAGVSGARPMLETLAKGPGLMDASAIRSSLYLIKDHGRRELRTQLVAAAGSARCEELRGIAAAALYEAGEIEASGAHAAKLLKSRNVSTVTWAALVRAALADRLVGTATGLKKPSTMLLTETNHRRIQLGWVE